MTRRKKRKQSKPRAPQPTARRGKNRTAGAAKSTDVIETLVAANAQALGLPLDPAWRESVKGNLQLILAHAGLVDQFTLPDEVEPAPVFRA
jgi:hypothetical protein